MNKRKILVISLSGIGNTLLATPFLKVLRKHYLDERIDFLGLNQGIVEVVEASSLVDDIFIFSKKFFKNLSVIRQLRRKGYAYSVTLFPSNKRQFNILAFLIGAKRRATHSYDSRNIATFSFLQNVKIPVDESLCDIEQNMNLLKAFTLESRVKNKEPNIFIDKRDAQFAEQFLKEKRLESEFLIGMHPGGGGIWDKRWQGSLKRWPEEYFARACDRLIELKKAKILIFGGVEEEELKDKIKDLSRYKKDIVIINEASLKKVSALIRKCKSFISNDTSLMHIGAALGVPTLGIFGPTNYKRTAPYGKNGYYIKSGISCSPCLKYPFYSTSSKIKCTKNLECLRKITPDDVINKLKEMEKIS
ncbi:MAG: glycosyltransferase family 9 protein [Candidatus Omnitrophica bacterium]|nr:glycosyltransferase family 9 protein [Candidatus Omnitrophota bacterium]MBU1133608.1 glycosyltransferase family 9 protein [Candidatus Omnitrophota bacterium]MBU1367106.1 glycosyltransferase family 9 protein [Candidatus Omnitrophota bacterium]MBU1810383.1 glycosyltransferase family 9 protein [Candidatus Omnitrophota bacterium]